jgi:hypothetical protein
MFRRCALAVSVYVAAAVALTWPLAGHLRTHLGAPEGPGDPFLNLWVMGWGIRSWVSDPLGTLTGRAFDAPIFHPAALTLTYSDHQLPQALLMVPVWLGTGSLPMVYNLTLLLALVASGLSMYALARQASGSTAAGLLAGLVWMAWPYRTAHLLHLQLQALYFMPLAVWALLRVAAARRWRDAVVLGASAGGQALVSVYYGVMTAWLLVLLAPAIGWLTGQWRARRYWTRVGLAALVAGLMVLPVALPYARARASEGFGRSTFEASQHAASLQSYTQVPPSNLVYGHTGWLAPRAPQPGERDRRHVEHQMFPGAVVLVLALIGLGAGWHSDRRVVTRASALLMVAAVWLSLGPEGPLGLYRAVSGGLPGFDAIRAPARFAVVAMLGVCLLAAVGWSWLIARLEIRHGIRRAHLATLVALCLCALEYANSPLVLADAPPARTATSAWLAAEPEQGPVLYLPIGLDRENTPFMVEGLEHGRPIVNGYSGQRPVGYASTVEALSALPASEGLAMLRELGVSTVVSDRALETDTPSPLQRVATPDGRFVYRVVWTPEAERALEAAETEESLPAGPLPFADGERLAFDVQWMGDVSAGVITLTVRAASADERAAWPGARWQIGAGAKTAPWVSRFFEADDQFSSLMTEDLQPLLHSRRIHEGPRSLTRAYLYDAVRRRVSTAADAVAARAADAAATPWVPGTRDAIGVLYYLRTQHFRIGEERLVPVNDAGTNLRVRVRLDGIEPMPDATGARVEAERFAVRLERRLSRRQPVTATLWMAQHGTRQPLRIQVSAGFGEVTLGPARR